MYMIGHESRGLYRHPVLFRYLNESLQVGGMVLVRRKAWLSVVTPLNDVLMSAGEAGSR